MDAEAGEEIIIGAGKDINDGIAEADDVEFCFSHWGLLLENRENSGAPRLARRSAWTQDPDTARAQIKLDYAYSTTIKTGPTT
jgi:hypothetical protein